MLGRTHGIGARGIDHGDAAARGRLEIDVVDPDAGPADHLQAGRLSQERLGDLGRRPDEEGIRPADLLLEPFGIAHRRYHLETLALADLVEAYRVHAVGHQDHMTHRITCSMASSTGGSSDAT